MFQIMVNYPRESEEVEMVRNTTSSYKPDLTKIFNPQKILAFQNLVVQVPASDHVIKYAVRLVRASRPQDAASPEFIKKWVQWGAGPRASQSLVLGGKARAVLNGRYAVPCNDIRAIARPVLHHRIIMNFHAEAEGKDSLYIIDKLLEEVKEY